MALLVEEKFLGVRKRPNLSIFCFLFFFCTIKPWPFWISIWFPMPCDFRKYILKISMYSDLQVQIARLNPRTTSKRVLTHCSFLLQSKMMLSQKIYIIRGLKMSKIVACTFSKAEIEFDHQNYKNCSTIYIRKYCDH